MIDYFAVATTASTVHQMAVCGPPTSYGLVVDNISFEALRKPEGP